MPYLYSIAEESEEEIIELAACTDFRERRNLREALRELKGLKLDGDKIITYSFGSDTLKRLSSIRAANKDEKLVTYSTPVGLSNSTELPSHTDKKGYLTNSVKDKKNENSGFSRYLNAGNICRLQNDRNPTHLSGMTDSGCPCVKNSDVPNKKIKKSPDDGTAVRKASTHPDRVNSKGRDDGFVAKRLKKQDGKIGQSSPFSSNLISPISKSVSKHTDKCENSSKESLSSVPNNVKAVSVKEVDRKTDLEARQGTNANMKTQDSKRNFSESSVPSPRNELSWADEMKKERSKSCNNENEYDIDGVKIRKKSGLSRKNRVEAEWNMSPRLSTKFRRKLGSSSDSISNIPSIASSTDSLVNTSDVSAIQTAEHTKKIDSTLLETENAKKPPVRRKLPEIPVQIVNGEEDSDETVHERTLRLLQERKQKRRDKFEKENEAETKVVNTPTPKVKGDVKPRSKKKEIRLRRELQLLNRASESIIAKTESQLAGKLDKGDVDEKPRVNHPVKRSKSDLVRSKPPITPESVARKAEESQEEIVVAVDLEKFDVLTTENKIDLIGNLMQEEAKLQETLRRTTSFSERRKIRSEVRQLREKRTGLEGSQGAEPAAVLQRSVSLSSGGVAATSKTNGESTLPNTKPSLEELRKQLSETSDYDEKRKIRLALRQLRQHSRESENGKQGTKLVRSQSCVEVKSPRNSVIPVPERSSVTNDLTVVQKPDLIDAKAVNGTNDEKSNRIARSQSVNETAKVLSYSGTIKVLTTAEPHVAEKENVADIKNDQNKSLENKKLAELKVPEPKSQPSISVTIISGQDICNDSVGLKNQSEVANHSSLSTNSHGSSEKEKHSKHTHSKTPHSTSGTSEEDTKTHHSKSKSVRSQSKTDGVFNHVKLSETSSHKSASERKRFSINEEKLSILQPVSAEKPYVKQRKHSLESLADSYRLRDQEDKSNRIFNAKLLNNVIGKLEDKISKSSSKILIRRASETSLLKDAKDKDTSISRDCSAKQIKDSENLLKTQHKLEQFKERHKNDKSAVNGSESQNSLHENDRDAAIKEISNERLSPNIPWLEEKKKSSPTPNDLDKLMSTMDIEDAFSQILDAVEHFPVGTDTSEPPTPEAPIVPIVEEDHGNDSSASGLESSNEEVDENKNVCQTEQVIDEVCIAKESKNVILKENNVEGNEEIKAVQEEDINKHSASQTVENKSAINSNSGIIKKSEAKIQLKSNLSLDLSTTPKENSAISVLHGDDGTITVQEVNRVQEGDTVITEWKKVRRTHSRTEERETDTIKERLITSPGGSSSVYEKDVSKTKRKLTSRGSDYFTRNNYNIRRLKGVEGTEIVEHELTSESENMSVTKNESWGKKSEAKVSLNKDNDSNQILPNLKAITPDVVPQPIKEEGDLTLTSGPSRSKCLTPLGHMTVSKTSSGYGSVSGSEEDDREDVIETPLGRPSGCPVISSNLKEVTVSEGCTAVLDCCVTSSPLPTVTWYKGTTVIQEDCQTTCHFDGTTGKATLRVSDVSSADVGEYSCVFTNPLGTAETKAKLIVNKRVLGPPSFLTELTDVIVSEGCSVVLVCQVTGADSVSWYKDGIIQRNSADFKQDFDGTKATLEIGEVFLDDFGTYTCAVKNSNAECRSSCKVTVTESVSDDVAPAFLKKLETQIVDEEDMVIMECDIIGSPQPVITWYCDRRALPHGDKFNTSYDGRVARLIMKSATKGDNGKYECVAESSAGRISCDCLLVVKEVRTPPTVTKPLSDVTVDDGKAAILECCILGNPEPQIVWRKNRLIIGQMFDFKQTFIDKVAKLEIGKVCAQDSGCYDCVATNDLGETSTSCNLTVQDKTVSKSTALTTPNKEAIPAKDETTPIPSAKSKTKQLKDFPSGFKTISDDHQVKTAKSQASKIMLVRQSSLRSVNQEKVKTDRPVKRSESFQIMKQTKKDDISVGSSDKVGNDKLESQVKGEKLCKSETEMVVNLQSDAKDSDKVIASSEIMSKDEQLDNAVACEMKRDSVKNGDKTSVISNDVEETVQISEPVDKTVDNKAKVTSVSSITLANSSKKEDLNFETAVNKDRNSSEIKISSETKIDIPKFNKESLSVELDHNENIKEEQKPDSSQQTKKDIFVDNVVQNEAIVSDIPKDATAPKLVIAVSAKDAENPKKLSIKDNAAMSKFEKLCSDAEKQESAKPRFKAGLEVRRTQSVRAPGSEKPEWLQMKLKKVGESKSPAIERKFIASVEKDPILQNDLEKPTSVPKDLKLSRSHSAKDVPRKVQQPLNDSTNTPKSDHNGDKLKLTPVSERAKMFQMNQQSSSPVLDRKNPSAIIAKAINLSRAESMRAPVGHRSINVHNVQRSHSFKTSEPGTVSDKGVTLDLSPTKTEGQEKSGDSGVVKKPVKYWDPTTAPTTNMSYATITDEEELHKLLTSSDNFEERKQIRARIKEVREIRDKKWAEERKQREAASEDMLKKRQKEADLEKQRKLEAYKAQAAQPHEDKHLEFRERQLKEKMKDAEERKQKELEAYDRMARKEDTSAESTVHTESRGGKTVTVRKVETVSKTGGVGGTSYGKPAEEEAEMLVKQLISASSPNVSGVLNVKTESWSSKDGITHKSEKTESWGAKKPAGAMNAFKQMDAKNNPQTNPLIAYTFAKKAATTMKRNAVSIKQDVLSFCQANTEEYSEKIEIQNFSTSWNDGIAFCALIHHFYPEAFDFYKLDPKNRRSNFELAFDTAEKYADIAPLLDVEDMVKMKKPDWKCVFTYVQSFYRKLKDHENNKVAS